MVSILQAPAQITEAVTIEVYASQADAQSGTNALYTKEYNAASKKGITATKYYGYILACGGGYHPPD